MVIFHTYVSLLEGKCVVRPPTDGPIHFISSRPTGDRLTKQHRHRRPDQLSLQHAIQLVMSTGNSLIIDLVRRGEDLEFAIRCLPTSSNPFCFSERLSPQPNRNVA